MGRQIRQATRPELPTVFSGQDLAGLSFSASLDKNENEEQDATKALLNAEIVQSLHLPLRAWRGKPLSGACYLPGTDDWDRGSLSSWSTSSDNGSITPMSDGQGGILHWDRQSSARLSKATSGFLFAEPSQTLIFLDWDDTLFPTSALFDRWRLPTWIDGCERGTWRGKAKHDASLPEELLPPLERWREAVYEFLCTACSLSDRCVIITNSQRPWVDGCINRFAPNLRQLLNREVGGPLVVYADEALREAQEASAKASGQQASSSCCFPFLRRKQTTKARGPVTSKVDVYTQGKSEAMRREAARFYSQYQGQTWKNVLSLGDMRYERDAVRGLRTQPRKDVLARERLRIKAFMQPDRPGLRELTMALSISRLLLPAYVAHDGPLDLDLRTLSETLGQVAVGLDIPSLKPLEPLWQDGMRQQDDTDVEKVLDEVALTVHDALSAASG